MNEYEFEEFNSVGTRFNINITLGESERFYLGNSFCQKYNVQSMLGVKLMYDKKRNAVGFRFLTENEDGMVKIKKLGKDAAYINAKAFLGIYNIDPKKYANRYLPKEIDYQKGKMFVIELKESQKIDS